MESLAGCTAAVAQGCLQRVVERQRKPRPGFQFGKARATFGRDSDARKRRTAGSGGGSSSGKVKRNLIGRLGAGNEWVPGAVSLEGGQLCAATRAIVAFSDATNDDPAPSRS